MPQIKPLQPTLLLQQAGHDGTQIAAALLDDVRPGSQTDSSGRAKQRERCVCTALRVKAAPDGPCRPRHLWCAGVERRGAVRVFSSAGPGLTAQLKEDMKVAMKAKDQARLGAIRLINAAIKQVRSWRGRSPLLARG
jgi:hypothetical protein